MLIQATSKAKVRVLEFITEEAVHWNWPFVLAVGFEFIFGVDLFLPEMGWAGAEWNGNEGSVCSRRPTPCSAHNG
jgi:hypothetical protein